MTAVGWEYGVAPMPTIVDKSAVTDLLRGEGAAMATSARA